MLIGRSLRGDRRLEAIVIADTRRRGWLLVLVTCRRSASRLVIRGVLFISIFILFLDLILIIIVIRVVDLYVIGIVCSRVEVVVLIVVIVL